jgi:hypothetical protein
MPKHAPNGLMVFAEVFIYESATLSQGASPVIQVGLSGFAGSIGKIPQATCQSSNADDSAAIPRDSTSHESKFAMRAGCGLCEVSAQNQDAVAVRSGKALQPHDRAKTC